MNLYPAIKAKMGDWTYYIVRMTMSEVAKEVNLAHEFYEDITLSEAIQRNLNKNRVRGPIVEFLRKRDDRFFSSLVVAAMGGQPKWQGVGIDSSVVPIILAESDALNDSFGILSFDSRPTYYALDGQHRLAAIKRLVDNEDGETPPGFEDEQVSVLVVLRPADEGDKDWTPKYRRLFSSLNRYTKPTDADTNIIMDEDDVFAIITRRLITDHDFFKATKRERDSKKVQTEGKNLKSGTPHFTSLQTLYGMNTTLLLSSNRENSGDILVDNKRIRPPEEIIDQYYNEIKLYWDAILNALPDLRESPEQMRDHNILADDRTNKDHLLFWPIGQELFAKIVRRRLDKHIGAQNLSLKAIESALKPLASIPWELDKMPWRYLLLVPSADGKPWRMRSEDRKRALEVAERLLNWFLEPEDLSKDGVSMLQKDWTDLLYGVPDEKEISTMWEEIQEIQKRIQG